MVVEGGEEREEKEEKEENGRREEETKERERICGPQLFLARILRLVFQKFLGFRMSFIPTFLVFQSNSVDSFLQLDESLAMSLREEVILPHRTEDLVLAEEHEHSATSNQTSSNRHTLGHSVTRSLARADSNRAHVNANLFGVSVEHLADSFSHDVDAITRTVPQDKSCDDETASNGHGDEKQEEVGVDPAGCTSVGIL